MSAAVSVKKPVELRMAGLRALNDALGYDGAQEFLNLSFGGSGDFTKERHEQPEPSHEEAIAEIMRLQNERAGIAVAKARNAR